MPVDSGGRKRLARPLTFHLNTISAHSDSARRVRWCPGMPHVPFGREHARTHPRVKPVRIVSDDTLVQASAYRRHAPRVAYQEAPLGFDRAVVARDRYRASCLCDSFVVHAQSDRHGRASVGAAAAPYCSWSRATGSDRLLDIHLPRLVSGAPATATQSARSTQTLSPLGGRWTPAPTRTNSDHADVTRAIHGMTTTLDELRVVMEAKLIEPDSQWPPRRMVWLPAATTPGVAPVIWAFHPTVV